MIDISHDGSDLTVTLTGEYPISGTRFTLRWGAGSSWAANLLWSHMFDLMRRRLRKIREESYERGWRDAKAHATKEKFFTETW